MNVMVASGAVHAGGPGPVARAGQLGKRAVRKFTRLLLPAGPREALFRQWYAHQPYVPYGRVAWGSLRRTEPICRDFGWRRGLPIDRYYIEQFLGRHAADVRGRVLEVGDDKYTRRFGDGRVARSDVLHIEENVPGVTITGDLQTGRNIPTDAFDCFILTQTLLLVFDTVGAIRHAVAAIRPGGVLLVTVPCIAQITHDGDETWGDCWRFTPRCLDRLLREAAPGYEVTVEPRGNVLTAIALMHGVATAELTPAELDVVDPGYPVIVTARVRRPSAA